MNNPTPAAPNPIDQLPIPVADPVTGVAYTPQQQLDMLIRTPEWAQKVLAGDPVAVHQKNRLDAQIAGVVVASQAPGQPARLAQPDAESIADDVAELRGYGLTQQQIAEELRRQGIDPTNVVGAGLTRPEDFRLPYSEEIRDPEVRELDAAARGWLTHAGFDADTGSALAEAVDKLSRREWTDESLEQHMERGRTALREVWGVDYEANVNLLDRFIGDVEQQVPGLDDFLHVFPFVLTEPAIATQLLGRARTRYRA